MHCSFLSGIGGIFVPLLSAVTKWGDVSVDIVLATTKYMYDTVAYRNTVVMCSIVGEFQQCVFCKFITNSTAEDCPYNRYLHSGKHLNVMLVESRS